MMDKLACDLPTFVGLQRHGPFGVAEGSVPNYLFQTQFGNEVMIRIQREYAALNDYMVSLSEIEIPVSESPGQAWQNYLESTPYDPSDVDALSERADAQYEFYEMGIDIHATTRDKYLSNAPGFELVDELVITGAYVG